VFLLASASLLVVSRTAAEQRLVCIRALFLLLRVWGTIQFFVFMLIGVSSFTEDPGCIPIGLHAVLMILGTLQVGA